LLVVFAASSCGWLGDPREKAQAALQRGDLAAARIEATNAVAEHPEDGGAYLLLGRILTELGEFITADRTLKKARELRADRSQVDILLARVLLKTQAFQRVLDELPVDPEHRGDARAAVLAARGQAFLAVSRIDDAKVAFDAALQSLPDIPEALVGQAQIAAIAGDQAGALALIERTLVKSPRSAEAWMLKAVLLRSQGNVDEALSAYEQWATLDTTNPTPRLGAAEMLIEARRFEDAQKQVGMVLAKAPGSVLANHVQGLLHFAQGRYDNALESAQAVLKAQPKHPPGISLMAMIRLATGALNQAEEGFRILLLANPGDLFARKMYAVTLIRMGNSKGAIDTLAPALEKTVDDPALLAIAAEAHMQARDFSRATALLEQAAKIRGDDARMLIRLATARIAAGDTAVGLSVLEQAVDVDKNGIAAEFSLGIALLNQRAFDKALSIARSIQSKQPKSPLGFNLAGTVQGRMGDLAGARRNFEQAVAIDPGYWPATSNLARIELAKGDRAAAQRHIERLLDHSKDRLEAMVALFEVSGDRGRYVRSLEAVRESNAKLLEPRVLLAQAYIASGLGDRALKAAQEAAAIAPSSPQVASILGTAQLLADRKSEALTTFRRLTTDHPQSAEAQLRLAEVHVALDDARAAEAAFGKALSLQPDYVEAMVGLAQLHARSGRVDEAAKIAARMREKFPKSALGYALAGDLMMSQGRFPEAAKLYDAGIAVAPAGSLILKRHAALTAAGQKPGLEAIAQWLSRHPNSPEMRIYLASRQYEAQQFQDAIANYRMVVEADPYHALALNNLANAYHQVKDGRALSTAEAAYKLQPDNAAILDTYGLLLTQSGKAQQGVEILRKALARSPKAVEIRVNYAIALARSGNDDAARVELEQVVASSQKVQLNAEAQALLKRR